MLAIRFLIAVLIAFGLATFVAAQPRTQPGFGFGLFGAANDVTGRVLTNPGLQKELNVTDSQREKLKAAIEKQASMQKEFRAGNHTTEQLDELNAKALKLAEELREIINETLSAEQRKRLRQIEVQAMGLDVFGDLATAGRKKDAAFGISGPTVAQVAVLKEAQAALKLTATQNTSIKAIADAFNNDRRAIVQTYLRSKAGQVALEEATKSVEKARQVAWGKAEELLDTDQKKTLKDLVGEPSGFGKQGLLR